MAKSQNATGNRSRRNALHRRLKMEHLKSRELMAADFAWDGDDLYVFGTDGDDNISVHGNSAEVRVVFNGARPVTESVLHNGEDGGDDIEMRAFAEARKIFVRGAEGNDNLSNHQDAVDVNLEGQQGNDYLSNHGDGGTRMFGGVGNDVLQNASLTARGQMFGGAGNDLLDGGENTDWMDGGDGHDVIFGRGGVDYLFGSHGDDTLHGGDGDDSLNGAEGKDLMFGEAGNDTMYGGDQEDQMLGGDGNDSMFGGGWVDHLYGGDGEDTIDSGYGRDYVDGGLGRDDVNAGRYGDTVVEDANDVPATPNPTTLPTKQITIDDIMDVYREELRNNSVKRKLMVWAEHPSEMGDNFALLVTGWIEGKSLLDIEMAMCELHLQSTKLMMHGLQQWAQSSGNTIGMGGAVDASFGNYGAGGSFGWFFQPDGKIFQYASAGIDERHAFAELAGGSLASELTILYSPNTGDLADGQYELSLSGGVGPLGGEATMIATAEGELLALRFGVSAGIGLSPADFDFSLSDGMHEENLIREVNESNLDEVVKQDLIESIESMGSIS